MTTDTTPLDPEVLETALHLIGRATDLARSYDEDVQVVVREAAEVDLEEHEVWSLFTRIVAVLHNDGVEPNEEQRARIAEGVKAEVDSILRPRPVADRSVPEHKTVEHTRDGTQADDLEGVTSPPGAKIVLVPRNGHKPRKVRPTPIFKGRQVEMVEGFVDITTINLWKGNHRVELWVQEFEEREGREPDDQELLAIIQGDNVETGQRSDPFDIAPLAKSIADRGVDVPPILTWDGQPWDGNRRIAASKYVQMRKGFSPEMRERARWVKVWVFEDTTPDVVDDIVVAMNFEPDYRRPWEEYIKARLVVGRVKQQLETQIALGVRVTKRLQDDIKREVATHYAILTSAVTRYLEMVRWADDFEQYHVEERGLDASKVRYKANDIFQYFYEIQAGPKSAQPGSDAVKLTTKLEQDDDLRALVYDLMYDVVDSGAHVRALHKVVADEPSLKMLMQAHEVAEADNDEAKKLVVAAIAEAAKNSPTKKTGFSQFVKSMVDRLGQSTTSNWEAIDTPTLRSLRKILPGTLGAIDGELQDRDLSTPSAEV